MTLIQKAAWALRWHSEEHARRATTILIGDPRVSQLMRRLAFRLNDAYHAERKAMQSVHRADTNVMGAKARNL